MVARRNSRIRLSRCPGEAVSLPGASITYILTPRFALATRGVTLTADPVSSFLSILRCHPSGHATHRNRCRWCTDHGGNCRGGLHLPDPVPAGTVTERLEALGQGAGLGVWPSSPPSRAPVANWPRWTMSRASRRRRAGCRLPDWCRVALPTARPPARSDDPLPLPQAIDSPQAREQLRQFVLAQLERERQEARMRQDERRQQREQERRDQVAKQLGLSPSETEKFNQILNDSRDARDKLRAQVEAGRAGRRRRAAGDDGGAG